MKTLEKSKKLTKRQVKAMAEKARKALIAMSQNLNSDLTQAGNVHAVFHAHYVNTTTGEHGIETLISEILASNGASFTAIESRETILAKAMLKSAIVAQVKSRFSKESKRYCQHSVETILSNMIEQGTIGAIQLTKRENGYRIGRPCKAFFLIKA